MHDESLDGLKPDTDLEAVQTKVMMEAVRGVKKRFNIVEARAVEAVGFVYKITDKYKDAKGCIALIEATMKKSIKEMTNDERLMLIAVGFLVRKLGTFKSSTKNVGRNDPCPCGSGDKFKKCCLELAKTHELERWRHGKQ